MRSSMSCSIVIFVRLNFALVGILTHMNHIFCNFSDTGINFGIGQYYIIGLFYRTYRFSCLFDGLIRVTVVTSA